MTSPVAIISNTTSTSSSGVGPDWIPRSPVDLWASCSLRRLNTWREFRRFPCGDQCGITIPSRERMRIPPGEKENHLQKCLSMVIRFHAEKIFTTVFIVKFCLQSCFFWKNKCTCIYLFVYLSFLLSFYLPGCLPICLSVCLFYPWYDAPWATGFLWFCKVWKHQYLCLQKKSWVFWDISLVYPPPRIPVTN